MHIVEVGFEVPFVAGVFVGQVVLALGGDLFAEGPVGVGGGDSPAFIRDEAGIAQMVGMIEGPMRAGIACEVVDPRGGREFAAEIGKVLLQIGTGQRKP